MAAHPATAAVRAELEAQHGPDRLAAHVGTHTAADDGTYVAECWNQATALVGEYLASTDRVATVDTALLARAVMEAGSELYHRKDAPQGVYQFAGDPGGAVRVSADPLRAVRPLLGRYVGPGIG